MTTQTYQVLHWDDYDPDAQWDKAKNYQASTPALAVEKFLDDVEAMEPDETLTFAVRAKGSFIVHQVTVRAFLVMDYAYDTEELP